MKAKEGQVSLKALPALLQKPEAALWCRVLGSGSFPTIRGLQYPKILEPLSLGIPKKIPQASLYALLVVPNHGPINSSNLSQGLGFEVFRFKA